MNGQAWVILNDLLAALPLEDADELYKMITDGECEASQGLGADRKRH